MFRSSTLCAYLYASPATLHTFVCFVYYAAYKDFSVFRNSANLLLIFPQCTLVYYFSHLGNSVSHLVCYAE